MRLSSDEIGLWRWAMRDVARLRGRAVVPDSERSRTAIPAVEAGATQAVPVSDPARPKPSDPLHARNTLPPLDHTSANFAGLDRRIAERLRRGRYAIEARLDLHGMTQAEAHRALAGFVGGSRALGRRCVLVITGHGRISGGILKAAAPRWLNEPELRRHVLAMTPAQQCDGGAGALYLLLRKAS